jgi:hypothetical protein
MTEHSIEIALNSGPQLSAPASMNDNIGRVVTER